MKLQLSVIIILLTLLSCKNTISKNQLLILNESVQNVHGRKLKIDSIDNFITNMMHEQHIVGASYVIINNAKIAYYNVKGYSDLAQKKVVTNQTIFEGASMSKALFSYLIMFMVEDGKFNLDKPLFEYLEFPEISNASDGRKITGRMILSHTSGLPNWRDNSVSQINLLFKPGTDFNYSGEGYQYLERVVKKILKTDDKGLEDYFKSKIASPLEMNSTKFVQDNTNLSNKAEPYENGKPISKRVIKNEFGAAYNMHSESKDFSKFVIALMNKKNLSNKTFNELFSDQVTINESSSYKKEGVTAWTLGFSKFNLNNTIFYGHTGNNPGYSCEFLFNREKNWGIIIFTNADQATSFGYEVLSYINDY